MATPIRPRRAHRGNYAGNARVVSKLSSGTDWDFLDPGMGPDEVRLRSRCPPDFRGDPEALVRLKAIWAEAWQELGELLTLAWVFGRQQFSELDFSGNDFGPLPGSRPWGWWAFEATEPLQGVWEEADDDDPPELTTGDPEGWRKACYFAQQRRAEWDGWAARKRQYPESPDPGKEPAWETMPAYLDRLGLWLPDERELSERMQREAAP